MYQSRHIFSKHRTAAAYVLIVIFSLSLIFITGKDITLKPKEIGYSVLSLFQTAFNGIGEFFGSTINSIQELKKMQEQYQNLQERLEDYEIIERTVVALQEENSRLREQLDFSESLPYEYVAAEIIGYDASNFFNAIMINKGRTDGIAKDMPVIAYQEGFQGLVGKIIEVGTWTSKILPLYDSSFFVQSRLERSRNIGMVNGRGNRDLSLSLQYVDKRANVRYGDMVVTSGMSDIYPVGINIGRVKEIKAPDWNTSYDLEIEPSIIFSKLEYVFVIKREKNEME